ncbi:MAG: hypothetical protein IKE75_03185 [Bacilli bacterium]|nr:hypothetical protein [Bacilli bacterium]
MINIRSKDLINLQRVGAGNFGTIYKKGDMVYKVYHEMVRTEYGLRKNPSLKVDRKHINMMMALDKKLKYTDLIKDVLFVDGKFGGVVLPYYDGDTLIKTMGDSISSKFEIAHQLVRNSKELTDNNIYPFDYKLKNIMLADGNVKFIDLDDYFTLITRIPYSFRKKDVVRSLDKTIKKYFNDNQDYPFSKSFVKLLGKTSKSTRSYQDIVYYISEKEKCFNYIFINDDVDFSKKMSLLRNTNYRIVYVYSGYDYNIIEENVRSLFDLGVNLYDVTPSLKMRVYLRSIMYDECIGLCENKVLNLKKKTNN